MSDLFKDHKPELSEEEDRLLWQRVRAIPALETAPALRPVPWWRKLWAMPGVRYGAPALAVLVAAVVWVTQREPEFKPRSVGHEASRPMQTAPPATDAPVPTRNSARVTAVDEKVVTKSDLPTKDKAEGAEWRADEVAPSENQREEVAGQVAPTTAALRKSAPAAAPTFAPPPSEVATRARQQAAEPVPAPAPQTAAMKAAPAKAADSKSIDSKEASRAADKPQWGEVKNGYRDSGGAALYQMQVVPVAEQLAEGTLPDPATLANHPVVQAASPTAYAKARTVPLPIDIATQADLKAGAKPYEDFAPAEQAAAIAYAFERALANPSATPRARIERMLAHAKAIEDRAGKVDKPGATKLVAMIEGALKAWP